jgi:hypothetical protein
MRTWLSKTGGGIRTDTLYPAGDITDLLIKQILPFGNTIVELEISGSTLLDALENGVSDFETLEGRFPQVSGMKYTWDPGAAAGNRIESIMIDETPLDESATYTLGTNNFMADGGDGYNMLTDATEVRKGASLADAVIAWIKDQSPISPKLKDGSRACNSEFAFCSSPVAAVFMRRLCRCGPLGAVVPRQDSWETTCDAAVMGFPTLLFSVRMSHVTAFPSPSTDFPSIIITDQLVSLLAGGHPPPVVGLL